MIIKISGSVLALYILYTEIDVTATLKSFGQLHPVWGLSALLAYNASQFTSARRLNQFFRQIKLILTEAFNLRLYYIGMFYNLLLPGGIGGDAFKAYLLNRRYGTKLVDLVRAMVADRASGLISIVLLIALLLQPLSSNLPAGLSWLPAVVWLVFLAGPVLFYFMFRSFRSTLPYSVVLSIVVQILQLACIISLMYGLKIDESLLPYLLIFLASSVATIIPVTVGGLGLREIVFLYGARYFQLQPEVSVTVSLLFFVITVVSSLPGLLIHLRLSDATGSADVVSP